ncbi:MAG: hypothetical protein K6G85_02725 [Eubacterium sp.]|nr:hypothetical protein [Eubacterium sp.]
MKKYQYLLIVFVFWWSLFCPALGYPQEVVSSDETTLSQPENSATISLRFKYLSFLNDYFQ